MLMLLIRHAKAEERGRVPDALRALTEEGRARIEKEYPLLAEALRGRSVRLISSPLVRAFQTAEVLERALQAPMELADWVAEGSLSALLREVGRCREDVLIVVGHEPALSSWSRTLGLEVDWLKKGSAAVFEAGEEIRPLGYYPLGSLRALSDRIRQFFDTSRS